MVAIPGTWGKSGPEACSEGSVIYLLFKAQFFFRNRQLKHEMKVQLLIIFEYVLWLSLSLSFVFVCLGFCCCCCCCFLWPLISPCRSCGSSYYNKQKSSPLTFTSNCSVRSASEREEWTVRVWGRLSLWHPCLHFAVRSSCSPLQALAPQRHPLRDVRRQRAASHHHHHHDSRQRSWREHWEQRHRPAARCQRRERQDDRQRDRGQRGQRAGGADQDDGRRTARAGSQLHTSARSFQKDPFDAQVRFPIPSS